MGNSASPVCLGGGYTPAGECSSPSVCCPCQSLLSYNDEETRASCFALEAILERYFAKHAKKNLGDTQVLSSNSYLVYRPGTVGWGNRVQGLCLAFAVSLLTDRTFLIDWKQPVPLNELIDLHPFLTDTEPFVPSVLALDTTTVSAFDEQLEYPRLEAILSQDDLSQTWTSRVVLFSSGQNQIDCILRNPHYKAVGSICKNADTGKNVFMHVLLKALFRDLSPPLKNSYLEFVSQLCQFKFVISLQIRVGSPNTSFICFVRDEEVAEFWDCARRIQACHPDSAILLTTDSAQIIKEAERIFGEKLFYFPGSIVHSGNEQTTDQHGKTRTKEGLYKVVIDWWVIGDGQVVICSRNSSFGSSAVARTLTASMTLPNTTWR